MKLPSERKCWLLTVSPLPVATLGLWLMYTVRERARGFIRLSDLLLKLACSNVGGTAQLHEALAYVAHGDARAAARRRALVYWTVWPLAWLLNATLATAAVWLAWTGARLAWKLAWALLLLPPRMLVRMLKAVYTVVAG